MFFCLLFPRLHLSGFSIFFVSHRELKDNFLPLVQENGAAFNLGPENTGSDNYNGFSLDMGMKNSLPSPRLALPNEPDPLYLVHARKETRPRVRKIDENRLLAHKFHSKPASDEEAAHCRMELNRAQIQGISMYPEALEFGDVSTNIPVSKSFAVSNDNRSPIIVSLSTNLKFVSIAPDTQVIRPGQTAGFDITVLATSVQEVRGPVTYEVNGLHTFSFDMHARPVPVNVRLAPTAKHFTIAPKSEELFVDDTAQLINQVR